jgi:hypothetical protein
MRKCFGCIVSAWDAHLSGFQPSYCWDIARDYAVRGIGYQGEVCAHPTDGPLPHFEEAYRILQYTRGIFFSGLNIELTKKC